MYVHTLLSASSLYIFPYVGRGGGSYTHVYTSLLYTPFMLTEYMYVIIVSFSISSDAFMLMNSICI